MPLQSFVDEERNLNPFNVHQAFTLIQKGPKTVKLLISEKNKDILGVNYDAIKKHHEQSLANQERKRAALKDGNKMKLPRHYEPKGLI
jgi:hypothetical protein